MQSEVGLPPGTQEMIGVLEEIIACESERSNPTGRRGSSTQGRTGDFPTENWESQGTKDQLEIE